MAQKDKLMRTIIDMATRVRRGLEKKYGLKNMMGKCIEASDTLAELLKRAGYNAKSKQVWVLYQNFESCSHYCYEEHWIVEVLYSSKRIYIDVTLDQFQWAFDIELPAIWFNDKLPTFFLGREPGRVTLKRCGWIDWYNDGNYVNNFEYRL